MDRQRTTSAYTVSGNHPYTREPESFCCRGPALRHTTAGSTIDGGRRTLFCKVTAPSALRCVLEQLRSLASERSFVLAAAGIVLLAFVVNLVELICSAGIPAVYTQVLVLSNLPSWQYHVYLSLYILVFILDDLFVFFIAMKTLQVTGLTGAHVRHAHAIGGAVLIVIGFMLLFKPEWLTFAV